MHKEESRNELGKIKIHKNVVASVASLAASEIEGVKRVGSGAKCSVLDFMGKKALPAIKVEFDKNEEVRLEVPLIIKYDFNIPEICGKVQENVRIALERMTSLSVRDVDINVQGIEK